MTKEEIITQYSLLAEYYFWHLSKACVQLPKL